MSDRLHDFHPNAIILHVYSRVSSIICSKFHSYSACAWVHRLMKFAQAPDIWAVIMKILLKPGDSRNPFSCLAYTVGMVMRYMQICNRKLPKNAPESYSFN